MMNPFEKFGMYIGGIASGVHPHRLHEMQGHVAALKDSPIRDTMFRKVASFAAHVYEHAEGQGSLGYQLFTKLANLRPGTWHHGYDRFAEAALRALGDDVTGELSKQALSGGAGGAAGAVAGAGAVASGAADLYAKLLSLSVLGGVGLGSGAWLFNRNTRQDEDKAEGIKAQIAYYKRVADRLNHELKADPELGQDVEKLQNRASIIGVDTHKALEDQRDKNERRERGSASEMAEAAIYV